VVRVRSRARTQTASGLPPLTVELTAIYQVDCMVSGIAQHRSSYIIVAYIPPDTFENEATDNPQEQRRKLANRPELRLIDKGEEITADALSLPNFHLYGCSDYDLVRSQRPGEEVFFVVSPADIIVVRPRDEADHIEWLVERERFEEALVAAEALEQQHGNAFNARAIGLRYMQYLIDKGDYQRSAALAPKVLENNAQDWETWINIFLQMEHLRVGEIGDFANERISSHTYPLSSHD
jgi:hypothetical protein